MIYTLFVWTVVAAYAPNGHGDVSKTYYDWRPVARVEASNPHETNVDDMLAKCAGVARELNIPRERYRCIRTK